MRAPTPKIARPTPIRPVAAPVNTYVRPADPAPSSLHQLAEGLAAFDSGLGSWLNKRQAEQDKADAVRGEAAFNRAHQAGWAEAVATGAVPSYASPIFMEAYKKAEGSHLGVQLREDWADAYANWDGRNSNDPAAFDTFLSDFVAAHVTTDDPYVLAGLNPHIEALSERAYQTYSTDRANTIYDAHLNTRAALVGDILDHAEIQGVTSEAGTDYEAVLSDILDQREEALGSGIRMADYDKQLVATIAAKAIEHGDPQLLSTLDQMLPGYDVKLSSLPDFRDVKATTITALEAEARRRTVDEAARQEAADKARRNQISSAVISAIAKDANVEIPDKVMKEWSTLDPEAPLTVAKARQTLQNDDTREDPEDLLLVEREIQEGATADDILALAANGVIKDPQTFRTLLDRVTKRQEALASGILTGQTAKRFLSTIKERTMPPLGNAMFMPDGLTDEGVEATRYFEQMLMDWNRDNPNAPAYEREKATNDIGEMVLKNIDRSDLIHPQFTAPEEDAEDGDQQVVDTKDAPDTEQPQTPAPSPAAPTPVARPEPAGEQAEAPSQPMRGNAVINGVEEPGIPAPEAPSEWAIQNYGQEAPPSLDQMDDAARMVIEERAESLGVTPEEYNTNIWKTVREELGESTELPEPSEQDLNVSSYAEQPHNSALDAITGAAGVGGGIPDSPEFDAYYRQIKGSANYFSSGRHRPPPGNPGTAKWQNTNLERVPVGRGANGRPLVLRVYRPAARAFEGFIKDLQATGYPIYNVGSANYRKKRGSGSLSEHSYGTAIDINGEIADLNGDGKLDEKSPRNAFSRKLVTDLPPNISELAAKWGLSWGGDWRGKKDAMHFEWTGTKPPTRLASN